MCLALIEVNSSVSTPVRGRTMTKSILLTSERFSRANRAAAVAAVLAIAAASQPAHADEGGVSFWLPGLFGSLAAVPLQPGWTVNETYYHWQGQAGADVAAAREITIGRFNPTVTLNLSGNLMALADMVFSTAIYTFEQPVLGGQASV